MRRIYLASGVSLMSLALGMAFAAAEMPSGLAVAISGLGIAAIWCFSKAGVLDG